MGYIKRENQRTLFQYAAEDKENSPLVISEDDIELEDTQHDIDNIIDNDNSISMIVEDSTTMKSFGCQINIKKKKRSAKVQTFFQTADKVCQTKVVKMKSVGVQCNLIVPVPKSPQTETIEEKNEIIVDESSSSESEDLVSSDCSFSINDTDTDSESILSDDSRNNSEERTFLVHEKNLLSLFSTCPMCTSPSLGQIKRIFGSMVQIEQECGLCHYRNIWNSQPMIGGIPAGNLLISCGILFSGSLPSKCIRFMNMTNMVTISSDTFFKHQKHYLQPVILREWQTQKDRYIEDTIQSNKAVCLGGDGRADTPGHSAKYGNYSLMDLDRGIIVEMQLVQSNEVQSSCHMEKEGLIRCVANLSDSGIDISTLVTDRHVQILKWVRENMSTTKHCVDVWHVAKGLKKKLTALSKEKDCGGIVHWIKSISNHLYWVAASTPSADAKLMLEKWLSVKNHCTNVHTGHGDLFTECCHEELEGRERKKKWLKPGTKLCDRFEDVVSSRQMKKDVPVLSTGQQTSCLEAYHAVINHFAPKMIGFSYHGQLCRLLLAVMHFNENAQRDQHINKNGETRCRVIFPKFKKGGYSLKKMLVKPTYDYADTLTTKVIELATDRLKMPEVLPAAPPVLCQEYTRPDKKIALLELKSRFSSSSGNK